MARGSEKKKCVCVFYGPARTTRRRSVSLMYPSLMPRCAELRFQQPQSSASCSLTHIIAS